jgi:radical SAM superfamily enzyme YgiQ (UPF0313 family)
MTRVVLISTYDLGRAPFGLASPAAWLREAGCEVRCNDLAVDSLAEEAVRRADLVAIHVPMHAATRLAARLIPRLRALAPRAELCAYGLYAAMNADHLRELGVRHLLSGEYEAGLVALARQVGAARPVVEARPETAAGRAAGSSATVAAPRVLRSLDRLEFRVPDRRDLPPLDHYARLRTGEVETLVGTTEASRGCKHLCRHCPVVPVYGGRFRVVPRDVVLADVRQQVASGARHITFGDPDFFNGVGHALPIVRALHAEFPDLTYDVTIKIEHLLRHADALPVLRETGCALVTSAVESVDDRVLEKLEKGHTRADFERALALCRGTGLELQPTFVAFTPWITREGYRELLATIEGLDLVSHVAPIQLALRLLIPEGSRLLELEEIRGWIEGFDGQALVHRWRHPDPAVDALQREVQRKVERGVAAGETRERIFAAVAERAGMTAAPAPGLAPPRAPVPFLTEPWYC